MSLTLLDSFAVYLYNDKDISEKECTSNLPKNITLILTTQYPISEQYKVINWLKINIFVILIAYIFILFRLYDFFAHP